MTIRYMSSTFDDLIAVQDHIRENRRKYRDILSNFYDIDHHRFRIRIDEYDDRVNLSSTAICGFTISEIQKKTKDESLILRIGKDISLERELIQIYNFLIIKIIDLNKKPIKLGQTETISLDEFTLLNATFLIKKLKKNILDLGYNSEDDLKNDLKLIPIIKTLAETFGKNQLCKPLEPNVEVTNKDPELFNFEVSPHPYIYFKFLQVVNEWSDDLKNNGVIEKDIEYIHQVVYYKAKYEFHRQMTLKSINDENEFDPQRLIYSLLIIIESRFSNKLAIDKALEIIFKSQLETGLLPSGKNLSNDFVLIKGKLETKLVTTKPILSSIECFNDMLSYNKLEQDLKKYSNFFEKVKDWIFDNVRKSSDDSCYLGWYPQSEGHHRPISWMSAHTLLYLSYYEEFVEKLINDSTSSYLNVRRADEIMGIKFEDLFDSYDIKKCLDKLGPNRSCRSALLFGPPGTGKSTMARAIALKLGLGYVEITPGNFLAQGRDMLIPNATSIFKRLKKLKNVVIFFDEVDQLVKSRRYDKPAQIESQNRDDIWFVTAMLPLFQELHDNSDIIYILATNRANDLDKAFRRTGRLDMILPIGSISWKNRYNELRKAVEKQEDSEILKKKFFGGIRLENDKLVGSRIQVELIRFLERTNYLPVLDFKNVVRNISVDISLRERFLDEDSNFDPEKDDPDSVFFSFNKDLKNQFAKFVKYCSDVHTDRDLNEIINSTIWDTGHSFEIISPKP